MLTNVGKTVEGEVCHRQIPNEEEAKDVKNFACKGVDVLLCVGVATGGEVAV